MKKIYFILAIGLSLLVYTCASANEADAPKPGTIKGKVTDTETPSPNNLPGALVTAESEKLLGEDAITATTDAEGNYEIYNVPPGEYVVTISKPRYDESIDFVTVYFDEESFHDVRLYRSSGVADPLDRGGAFWGLLVLCVVVVVIYAISRRSSNKAQNR